MHPLSRPSARVATRAARSALAIGLAVCLAAAATAQTVLPHPHPDAPLVESTSPQLPPPFRWVRVPGGLMMELIEPTSTVRATRSSATPGLPSGYRYVDIRSAEEAAQAMANPEPYVLYRWVK